MKKQRTGEKPNMSEPLMEEPILQDGDCFAKEWDGLSRECRACSDFDRCGILFDRETDKKIKAIEQQEIAMGDTPLDLVDLSKLDPERIRKILVRKTENGQELPMQTLTIGLMAMAFTDDMPTISNWIKRFLKSEGIYRLDEERGVICRL